MVLGFEWLCAMLLMSQTQIRRIKAKTTIAYAVKLRIDAGGHIKADYAT